MIVLIHEQSTLTAVQVYLEPSTPPDERKADLACLIAIPPHDRQYDNKEHVWIINHPMLYLHTLPMLKPFINRISAEKILPFQK